MRLDTDPFLANVNVIDFEGKKVLVRPIQADTMKGENAVISDEPRIKMLKTQNPEPVEWKVNRQTGSHRQVKLTSNMLLEKYMR
jgi:hypothetical protein